MNNQRIDRRSVLARLRDLSQGHAPDTARTALKLAERQATLLRHLTAKDGMPLEDVIVQMPRIRVHCAEIPTSGLSHWNGREWVITLNVFESRTRQRFTLLHEYKHIIDHPTVVDLHHGRSGATSADLLERSADYFAGCALVPGSLLIDAWNSGITAPGALAALFDVSVPAIRVRLKQVGLADRPHLARTPRPGLQAPTSLRARCSA